LGEIYKSKRKNLLGKDLFCYAKCYSRANIRIQKNSPESKYLADPCKNEEGDFFLSCGS